MRAFSSTELSWILHCSTSLSPKLSDAHMTKRSRAVAPKVSALSTPTS